MKKTITAVLCAAMLAAVPTAGAVYAAPTGNSIYVDGVQVNGAAYKIEGSNYFKLRDIAAMVNGSTKQFSVAWNNTSKRIDLTSGRPYTVVGGELALPGTQSKDAKLTSAAVYKNGSAVSYTGYNIDSNNYYKLRDLCRDMNIGVKFDAASRRVDIVTTEGYTEDGGATAPVAITKWNSTMYEFNEAMIDCNWNQSKYLEVAKQYGPVITGKANATTSDVVAALEAMTGAPVDAVSMDDKPVNVFWAKELRKAMGENVADNKPTIDTGSSDNDNSSAGTGSNSTVVTDAMLRQWEQEMITLVNEERSKVGAPILVEDENLTKFAEYWAKHLPTDFRHSDIDDLREFASLSGTAVDDLRSGENVSGGGNIANMNPVNSCMKGLLNSEGHRATMLDPAYHRIGIGFYVTIDGQFYCDQRFGR